MTPRTIFSASFIRPILFRNWTPPSHLSRIRLSQQLNGSQSLRILEDRLSQNPKPYFCATLEGVETGTFDFLFDPQRREQVLIGQHRKSGNYMYYDIWASYSVPGSVPPPVNFTRSITRWTPPS